MSESRETLVEPMAASYRDYPERPCRHWDTGANHEHKAVITPWANDGP